MWMLMKEGKAMDEKGNFGALFRVRVRSEEVCLRLRATDNVGQRGREASSSASLG